MTGNHYCTYFDRGFLPRALVLWHSLREHDDDAILWVLALDEDVSTGLVDAIRISEGRLRVVPVGQLEHDVEDLNKAKASRSRIEYYFTLTPVFCDWLMRSQTDIPALVYLDADLMFFSSVRPVWEAFEHSSIFMVAHDFPPEIRHFERHGIYNVGVLGWRRDANGLACLESWRDQCLEWCYDRIERGRYADQGYLNDWPQRFDGVVVCAHPGINLGPWNWLSHDCVVEEGRVSVDGNPLVVFHFAALKQLSERVWNSGQLDYGVMPSELRQVIYAPYLEALDRACSADAPPRFNRTRFKWIRWLWLWLFGAIWRRTHDGKLEAIGGWLPGARSGAWLGRLRGEQARP